MDAVSYAFLSACGLVVGINWLANHLTHGKMVDARGVAVMLTLMCAASNLRHVIYPDEPRSLFIYPAMDLLALVTMYIVSARQPRVWKIGVGLCLLTDLFLHALYLRDIMPLNALWQYYVMLDILFALQLLFAAVPGGISLGRYCLSHLPSGWLSRHGILAGQR